VAPRAKAFVLDARAYAVGVAQTVGTVPAGHIWLVRDVTLRSTSALAVGFSCSILRSGTNYPLSSGSIPTAQAFVDRDRYVALAAGDSITVTSTVATTISVIVSGADLET